MREQIVINSTHYVQNSGNQFIYKLLTPKNFPPGSKLSLLSFSLYNQTFNITSTYNNNTFSIIWLGTTYNFVIPSGYYAVSDINAYIQYCLLQNNLYVTTSQSTPYYFIAAVANSIQYSAQISVIPIPTAANATTLGYTKPSGATWSWPSIATTPQIVLSAGLGEILGFSSTMLTLPAVVKSTNQSFLSNQTPILSPIYSYLISCNLLNSSMSIFNQLMFQVPLGGTGFGDLLTYNATMQMELDIHPGVYSQIQITFNDQNYNPLSLIDPELTLILLIDY
jgi:hypothetical protein